MKPTGGKYEEILKTVEEVDMKEWWRITLEAHREMDLIYTTTAPFALTWQLNHLASRPHDFTNTPQQHNASRYPPPRYWQHEIHKSRQRLMGWHACSGSSCLLKRSRLSDVQFAKTHETICLTRLLIPSLIPVSDLMFMGIKHLSYNDDTRNMASCRRWRRTEKHKCSGPTGKHPCRDRMKIGSMITIVPPNAEFLMKY